MSIIFTGSRQVYKGCWEIRSDLAQETVKHAEGILTKIHDIEERRNAMLKISDKCYFDFAARVNALYPNPPESNLAAVLIDSMSIYFYHEMKQQIMNELSVQSIQEDIAVISPKRVKE